MQGPPGRNDIYVAKSRNFGFILYEDPAQWTF